MSDIVARLREATRDKDNMPRMDSERWFPVGLAREAAAEIERLRADNAEAHRKLDAIAKHPDTPLLIKQYASGTLDGRALEPKP